SFPTITVRDIVRVQKRLLEILGVRQLVTVCGSSLGGMQVLEWGIMYPDFCRTIIPISTSSKQSSWCIALNTIARTAIMGDPDWNEGNYVDQPRRGLSLARMVGMVSYRSPEELEQRFGRERKGGNTFDFSDANTYITLSRAMDLHDVGRGRGETWDVLKSIKARTLCVGVSSDIRYPTREQKELVTLIPDARYDEVQSIHGHDAFLIEFEQLNRIIHRFLQEAGE
ncbi:MAG: metX, partial [Bacteroidetes bacterium]|nr:metX [Bacteroidota bacterium]